MFYWLSRLDALNILLFPYMHIYVPVDRFKLHSQLMMHFLVDKPSFKVVLFCIHWGHPLSLIFASNSHSCHRQFSKLKLYSFFWSQMSSDWAQQSWCYQTLLKMKLVVYNTVDNSVERDSKYSCTVTEELWKTDLEIML